MNIAHYIHKPADIFRYHSLPVRNMYHRLSRLLKFRDYRCRSLEVERNQSPQDKISDKKGYCFTSALSKKRVLINAIDYGKERIEKYNSDKISKNGGKKDYLVSIPFEEDDLNCPLLELATSSELINIASDYFGFIPILSNLQLWYSPNKNSENTGSQLFHMDYADVKQCKFFIPVEEIDHNTGPLTFLPADQSKKIALTVGYKLKEGQHRLTDNTVENIVGSNHVISAVGKPGEVIAVDTCRCFHYGSRKASKPRSMIMIQYVSPSAFIYPWAYTEKAHFAHLANKKHSKKIRMLLGKAQ